MFNWMKRVIATGVMALAVTSTTGALVALRMLWMTKSPL